MPKAARLRAQYAAAGLSRADAEPDPLAQFHRWHRQAREADIVEVNAMLLATASASAAPSQRSVLMKAFDQDGLVFFTNHHSRKGEQMRENNAVSAVFPWYALHRQVLIEGHVERIGEAQSRAYFESRPRLAQLGAWVSRQSTTLASRRVLEARLARIDERFSRPAAAAADILGRLSHPPAAHGILARPPASSARPHSLHSPARFRLAN